MSKIVKRESLLSGDFLGITHKLWDKTMGALWDSLTPDEPVNDLATLGQGLQKGIDQPRRITFGRDRVGGVIAHQAEIEKNDKKWMQLIVLINGAPIDALEEIYIADKKLSEYPSESWDYSLSDGRQTTANAKAVAKMAGWTSEHIGFGQSYVFIEIENNREVFEDGISDMGFLIRGARVWDPRDTSQDPDDESTWLWSQNAVLCALHYVRFYGAHEVPFERLPLQWWIAAINVCDEDAEFTDAEGVVTTEPRYTTNGSFTFSTKPIEVLNQLEACFAGKIFRQMGQWYVRVGAWYGNPTHTINQDDVHGNIKIKWHADLRDRANVVRATFTDPEQNYDRTDAPPVMSKGYQAIDNQTLEKTITLPFVRSSTTAQRLSTIYMEQTRLGEIELPLKHKGLAAAVGRTVYLNLPRESISNKIYRVTERRFRLDGGVTLMCVEDGPDLWADNIIPGAQDLTPNSDYLVGKPQPTFDVRVTIDGDGNGIIKWNHPTPLAVHEYDVEFINTAANGPVFKTSVTYTQVTIPNLQLGEYTARISAKNIFGQRSLLVAVQFSVLTPTLPSVYVTADYNQITLTAEIAAAGIGTQFEWEFLGTAAQPHNGERVLAQIYNRIGLKSETEYKFRVRSVNHLGASDWVNVTATTTTVDLTEYINELPLTKLSTEAQTLIADINAQVDRLRPETENNLPSLITKNLNAITELSTKIEVLDAENPHGIPFKIDQLVDIVDVINAENPNNLQQQLADSNSKINDLERVTEVLDETKQNSLPALIKINNIAIEQQRLEQQSIGLSLLNVTSAYTSWRTEYERRTFNNERLIDAAVYVDPDTGTIVNRAYAIAEESFNSATLLIDGVNSKITLASQQITQSQNRISQAEAQLIVQAAQINQKASFAEVDGQIAGALAALQPAYSWQFNTSNEGFDPDSHNALGYIVATAQISSPVISYNADENPVFRLRVRKHSGTTWRGDIKFNGGSTTLHLPEPTSTDFETLTLDATGTASYTGTITSLEFDLGPCDIDFIEVGKRGANDLALTEITARTTELEQDINAATGIMGQYATTAWVNALGYQTQSNVQTLIDSFNAQYSIAATLQEFNEQDIIVKANAAQTWINGAEATIRDQVTSILNSEDGVNQRISIAEQSMDAIAGEISQSITQVSGLEIDVKGLGLNEVIAAYNKMQQDKELAEQSFSLATANQKLTAVTDDVKSLATQTLELAGLYGQNAAYLTSLNQAFANERTARSSSERELRAEITREGTRSVAQANERVDAIVGYCVDAGGNKVGEPDAMACIALGHEWIDGPLVQLINDYTTVFVNEKGYQTAANVQQFISTFDGEHGITATIQQINDEGIITAAKEAQQWVNAAEGTITNLITQFVAQPDGINDSLAFAHEQIQANADDIQNAATARQQLSVRMGEAESDLVSLDEAIVSEQQARASQGNQLRIEFQTQDLAMLATANEFTRAVTGYCVDANGERVDQDDAVQCELDGHTWVDGPAVQRAINLSAAYVDEKGYQTQNNVQQILDTWDASFSIKATIQQINDEGIITAAKEAQQWINAAEGTITNLITQFVAQPDGINESIALAEESIRANADDIQNEATARQQLSVRMGEAESDLISHDEAIVNEQQARASMGAQLRIEFQTQDLAMLATANEFTRAVTGYCVDANGERVDQDDAVACEAAGHTWIDGPAVQRAVEIGAAWVTLQGYQTQSNVNQILDTFNSTYKISATLQEFDENNTLTKANNAQQFLNGKDAYFETRITAYNAKEDGVDAKFTDVQQRLDAAEGAVTTSILQIQGLELGQQAQGLNDVIAAYNQFKQDNDLATLNVKAALANEKLQSQSTDLESLAQQQLELAAIFNSNNAIITSLNKAVANQYQSSVTRDQRYQATFDNVTARFSDVTTAIATIDEANTLRDVEFESFVAETIASFDEVAETFASQNQAFSTLQQTLTSKINDDTEAAKNAAIATAQEYTRTAVGYCLDAQGQITSENDAVQCVADGGSWVNGPLAEFIANMQITDGENSASIKQLRQLFTTVDGKLVARGGWTLDNNGRVTGIAGYNDGVLASLDIVGDVIRQGAMVDGTFVPTSYVDNSDPLNPEHVFKGRMVLGDGHTVSSLEDIKAQDGKDGKTRYVEYVYSVTGSSGWHSEYTTGDLYRRERTIENGEAITGWSVPARITGLKGDKGDTPSFTTNPDGSYTITNGTDTITIKDGVDAPIPTVTDNGNGTHTVTDGAGNSIVIANGNDGYTPLKGTDYFDGLNGNYISLVYRAATSKPYKPVGGGFNGATENIPSLYQDAPYFEESKTTYVSRAVYIDTGDGWANQGWSEPAPYIIKGDDGYTPQKGTDYFDGEPGLKGSRGAGRYIVATSSGAWSDASANSAVPSGSPVINDIVTIYKSSDPKIENTKRYTGSSWQSYVLRVHGSALIEDTLDGKVLRAGTRIESPRIDLVGSAFMKIELASGFGPDNLWYWYGPKIMSNGLPNLAALRKSNALEWKDTSGNAYFGGSISAGLFRTALTTTDLAANANVTIGPFGSNGGIIDLICSLQANTYRSGRSEVEPTKPLSPRFSIVLYEFVNSNWVTRRTQSYTGTSYLNSTYDHESRKYIWSMSQACSGSFTYTDNKQSTVDRTYKLAISVRDDFRVSSSFTTSQKLTLVSQED
ncbi:hypothetical protein [Pseudoalteromonas neustonica]|uniref:hypothetical protein n=1 Tax=Pseudoalteromonas neustonica TaxID=1840331 RepID=UPI0007DB3946|nr:hypothetical protein [Pseudoalteromonas neustonica]